MRIFVKLNAYFMSIGDPVTLAMGAALASAFARKGQTQAQVAIEYGVSQSRVGRIYAGDFTQRSDTARQMCRNTGVKFFEGAADTLRYAHNRRRLMRLLDGVWNGTDEDATRVAHALAALSRLRQG